MWRKDGSMHVQTCVDGLERRKDAGVWVWIDDPFIRGDQMECRKWFEHRLEFDDVVLACKF